MPAQQKKTGRTLNACWRSAGETAGVYAIQNRCRWNGRHEAGDRGIAAFSASRTRCYLPTYSLSSSSRRENSRCRYLWYAALTLAAGANIDDCCRAARRIWRASLLGGKHATLAHWRCLLRLPSPFGLPPSPASAALFLNGYHFAALAPAALVLLFFLSHAVERRAARLCWQHEQAAPRPSFRRSVQYFPAALASRLIPCRFFCCCCLAFAACRRAHAADSTGEGFRAEC